MSGTLTAGINGIHLQTYDTITRSCFGKEAHAIEFSRIEFTPRRKIPNSVDPHIHFAGKALLSIDSILARRKLPMEVVFNKRMTKLYISSDVTKVLVLIHLCQFPARCQDSQPKVYWVQENSVPNRLQFSKRALSRAEFVKAKCIHISIHLVHSRVVIVLCVCRDQRGLYMAT